MTYYDTITHVCGAELHKVRQDSAWRDNNGRYHIMGQCEEAQRRRNDQEGVQGSRSGTR